VQLRRPMFTSTTATAPKRTVRLTAAASAVIGMLGLLAPAIASAHVATHFQNIKNRLCLTSASGGHVSMGSCNEANDWYAAYDGFYAFIVDRHTGLCLEATHNRLGGVYTRRCDRRSSYQRWTSWDPTGKAYAILNTGTNQCLAGSDRGHAYMNRCFAEFAIREQWTPLPGPGFGP
jgi:Ricin-type beta-trefoil lectin domain